MRLLLTWLFLSSALLETVAWGQDTEAAARTRFSESDRKLHDAYQRAKREMPGGEFAPLREEQRRWIDFRDRQAEQVARLEGGAEEGAERATPEFWNTAASLTEVRTGMIEGLIAGDLISAKRWEGVWTDGAGGWLRIAEQEGGKLLFFLEVVRGASYHTGSISGVASAEGERALFSVRPEDFDRETRLTFVRQGKRLQVSGENTEAFHGARAYFDGTYVRTAAVDLRELEMLIRGETR